MGACCSLPESKTNNSQKRKTMPLNQYQLVVSAEDNVLNRAVLLVSESGEFHLFQGTSIPFFCTCRRVSWPWNGPIRYVIETPEGVTLVDRKGQLNPVDGERVLWPMKSWAEALHWLKDETFWDHRMAPFKDSMRKYFPDVAAEWDAQQVFQRVTRASSAPLLEKIFALEKGLSELRAIAA